jgi:lysophospholipase L1-like esterase
MRGTTDGWSRRARRAVAALATAVGAVALAPAGVGAGAAAGNGASAETGGTGAAAHRSAASGPAEYVALGDSFTAGPLIPNQLADPLGCLRSNHDYPHVVAAALAPAPTAFRDVSCSGADTGDMTEPQGVTPGPNPPQLDALSPSTSLVTLGIGGNDIGFSEVITSCVTLAPWETPCRDTYTAGGVDELSRRIAGAAPEVAGVLADIRTRSPQARVLVVGYPAIVPDSGPGCWPTLPFGWQDVSYLRAKHKELNAMLAAEAAAAGATYVDTYTPSIGRDACASPLRRWVEPLVPATAAAPVHPNARGMRGQAAAVLAELR